MAYFAPENEMFEEFKDVCKVLLMQLYCIAICVRECKHGSVHVWVCMFVSVRV